MDSNSTYKLFRPVLDDLPLLESFYTTTLLDTFQQEQINSTEEISSLVKGLINSIQKDLDQQGKSEFYLILKKGQEIIGTAAFGQTNSIIYEHCTDDYPEIKSVYIHPLSQKQGWGKFLFLAIVKEMNQRKLSHFYLDTGYQHAAKYWQQHLGKPKLILKDYWGQDQHHYIWKQNLHQILG
ncbi:MAG: GNAT family N-acetyltransferase [Saprospiraceae bacterium]|nr:GNAT family N-acetyltransferase [Saprospiraceae bacterium]